MSEEDRKGSQQYRDITRHVSLCGSRLAQAETEQITYQCLCMILLSQVTLISQIGKQNSAYLDLKNAEELGQIPLLALV